MSDVTLSYKGSDILELSNSGSATLKTGGKYCEDDIELEYVKPSGGGVIVDGGFIGVSDLRTDDVEIYLNASSATNVGTVVQDNNYQQYKKITITAPNKPIGRINIRQQLRHTYLLEEIEVNGLVFDNIYQSFQSVYGAQYTNLKSIHSLDLSGCGGLAYTVGGSSGNGFAGQAKLETFLLVPNTLGKRDLASYAGNILHLGSSDRLTTESLVSIANGFCATNPSIVALHNTPKASLSTIMGTVSTQTDDDGTYDFFTADPNGTVTLLDFITNTKGWTVA